jgi:SAM-dependent methyltransferase
VIDRLYQVLACPSCNTSPEPGLGSCPGCGRSIMARNGGLDLLDDDARQAADDFADQYQQLRLREGWTNPNGKEDPGDRRRRWRGRVDSMDQAAALLAREWPAEFRAVVGDIGAGGGWAARILPSVSVLAIDILDVSPGPAALTVRADMRKLPFRNATLDAVLYAASLHHAPIELAIGEAARVVRPKGLIVAVDSPIYRDARGSARATMRTARYYASVGYPSLSDHYHPIDAQALRSALIDSGFAVERLSIGGRWRRLLRGGPGTIVVARRLAATG